ncbi:MAG: hypothetical protein Q8K55_14445 [Gemmatimonadaceae bacterium]|nr:hypothetical protein [Gemmatimonadaceae bacterium]
MRLERWWCRGFAAIAITGALACKESRPLGDTDGARLDVLATQAMVPGESLGTIRLGEMTIAQFASAFGSGVATMLQGDEVGIELSFRDRQLSFLFLAEGACDGALRSAGRDTGPLMGDRLAAFQARFPDCRDMPLHSIAVVAGPTPEQTFWRGKVAGVAGLWDPASEAGKVPGEVDGPARFVAGMSASRGDLDSYRLLGTWIEYEREGQAASSSGPVIRYITIFRMPTAAP